MPLPLILGAGAAIAGLGGVVAGASGAMKMKKANDVMNQAKERNDISMRKFDEKNKKTSTFMDELGEKELRILNSFERFSDVFEKIKNRPNFEEYSKEGVNIPKYNHEELKNVSIGAGVLLGGLGGAAMGTAGGFAAAGATTAAVMALGTASTGTAIASLSGAAAINAALAALGGGAIAAGGGGMALGTTILGASTLGVGLLIGGVIFNITGSNLSEKADVALNQVKNSEQEVNKICRYLDELGEVAGNFEKSLDSINKIYRNHFMRLSTIVERNQKTDWNLFTDEEKLLTENIVLLVNLLFNMGKVKLVIVSKNKNEMNKINKEEVEQTIQKSEEFIKQRNL